MKKHAGKYALILLCAFSLAPTANAQAPGAPEWWPCIQRYVPSVSAGRFWEGGLEPGEAWMENEEILRIARRVADRDISAEDNLKDIEAFLAAETGDQKAVIEDLLRGIQHMVNKQRDHIIKGISRFADRQNMMIRRIEKQTYAMEEEGISAGKRRDLEDRQKWDIRVFEEREGMIAHLCEQPVLLAKKFFTVGRAIAETQDKR